MTKARMFEAEEFVDVKKSIKEAEKVFRYIFPDMKKVGNVYSSDKNNSYLLFIHEKELG